MIVRRILLFIKKDLNLTLVNNYIHENMVKIFGCTKTSFSGKCLKTEIFQFLCSHQTFNLLDYYTQWLMIFRKKRENAINLKCFYITIKISLEILKVNRSSYFIYISYCWNDDYKNNIFLHLSISCFLKKPEYFHWSCIKFKLI